MKLESIVCESLVHVCVLLPPPLNGAGDIPFSMECDEVETSVDRLCFVGARLCTNEINARTMSLVSTSSHIIENWMSPTPSRRVYPNRVGGGWVVHKRNQRVQKFALTKHKRWIPLSPPDPVWAGLRTCSSWVHEGHLLGRFNFRSFSKVGAGMWKKLRNYVKRAW